MSETPEQIQSAVEMLEARVASLTTVEREALEAFLAANTAPLPLSTEEEAAVAAVLGNVVPQVSVAAPKIEALPVKHVLVPRASRAVPIRDARQTIPAVRPLQPLER